MVLLLPAERDDDLLVRYHLDELASGLVFAADEHPVDAAAARVELGDGADPFDVLVAFGEEGPDGLRGGVDHDLTDELGHQWLLCLVGRPRPRRAAVRDRSSSSRRGIRGACASRLGAPGTDA